MSLQIDLDLRYIHVSWKVSYNVYMGWVVIGSGVRRRQPHGDSDAPDHPLAPSCQCVLERITPLVLPRDPAEDGRAVALGALFDDLQHALPYLAGLLARVNALPDARLLVVADHRGGLGVVGAETLLQGLGVVVGALDEGLAGDVVLHVLLGRVERAVIAAPGGRVNETAGDALDEERVVDLELDGVLQGLTPLLQHGIETLGLGDSAREAVENKPVKPLV